MNDVRFALRQLVHSPAFTILAIVTLGLGIGVNTSMFSVLNEVLFRSLPYPGLAELVSIERTAPHHPAVAVSAADYFDLQRGAGAFGRIAAYSPADASLSEPGRPAEMVYHSRLTTNFLALLGVAPQLGRDFRPEEDIHGNDRVVILSHRCWVNRFGAQPAVVGRTIRLDGEPHEVIGVLPAAFSDWRLLGYADFFRPLALDPTAAADRRATVLRLIGRRAPQVPAADASRFIAGFGARLAKDYPEVNAGTVWRAVPLQESVISEAIRAVLPMLVGLSGFVLLIACSNLANLLLARTISRAREFAVRSALGASRGQLLRPLVAESLILAFAGGLLAILVARWVTAWFTVRSSVETGEGLAFTVDWRVLAWTFGAALVTAIAFGLAPALFALRLNLNETLKCGGRGLPGGLGHRRFRHALIVGQFALAMVLLAGAGVFIRGLDELNHRRTGWDSDRLVTGTILLPAADYPQKNVIAAFHRSAIERIETIPGIASASLSSYLPFVRWFDVRRYLVEGRELPQPGQEPAARVNTVSAAYFETVGTRVLAGRSFDEHDDAAAPRVFMINESMAKALFGDTPAIGHRLAQFGGTTLGWGEIVGVVANVKSDMPDDETGQFQLYQPMAQEPRLRTVLCARASGVSPAALLEGIRNAMTQINPDLPIRNLWTAEVTVQQRNYQVGILRDILTYFALLGLGLATLGVYGVIARTMAQRTVEFAVRIAVGATLADISALVLTTGAKLAAIGSAAGWLGAWAVCRVLAASFPNMRLESAPVMAATALLLVGVALAACWLPARRAGHVEPMLALRAE